MKIFLRIFVTLTIFYHVIPLRAGESPGSSHGLAGYVKEGLTHHPGLRSAYERYRIAVEKVPQARSLPGPVVSWTHFLEEVQTRTGPQRNQFMLSQTIPLFGKIKLREGIASREAAAAHREYESRRLEVVREISEAYYRYASLAKEMEITAEILELLGELDKIVQEQVRTGGDYSATLKLQVELGKTEDQLRALKRERERRSAVLETAVGRKTGEEPLPWPALSDAPLSADSMALLRAQMLAAHPRLASLRDRIVAADDRVRLARKSPLPDPSIGVNYIDIGDGGNNAVGVSVGFRLPIWFGKYKAERREAEAAKRAVEAARSSAENELLSSLTIAMADFEEATGRIVLYREKLLPSAEKALKVTETGYTSGKSSILDLIDSERTLLELKRIYWRAVGDAHASLVELQTLTGKES